MFEDLQRMQSSVREVLLNISSRTYDLKDLRILKGLKGKLDGIAEELATSSLPVRSPQKLQKRSRKRKKGIQ